MSNNRVEQLESTVAELESTVEGLTDELIEAKERIRVLEAELDAETPTRVPERRRPEESTADAQTDESSDSAPMTEAEPDDVAKAAADAEEETTGDEAEDSGSDDIIVA
ncbi:hypothetical protein G6M89_12320 [Natronolimnobius sp. AArcel1]|uniref:DUF7518 family protein n=1 Tax=Natronolimnobius sp. AArcel1 TaxID=1679093 RepID=UPI0013E9D822|nr:hypothetical protein [Natronolimnobius sp. AArcel1]NGM69782.1 hypothetical protein [Natronolimnobius sp. AArcel1]